MYLIDEDVPYYKTSIWTQSWSKGDNCKVVDVKRVTAPAVSLNRSPPPLPGKPKEQLASRSVEVPAFDIQEIPDAMRHEGMPIAAKLMERWFAGELNYAPSSADVKAEINQKGLPYPDSMYDTTTVTMNWALEFKRAREAFRSLTKEMIYNFPARYALKQVLTPYRNRATVFDAWSLCKNSMRLLHSHFQFQRAVVGSSLSQKIGQFIESQVENKGVPDDLNGALGAFNIYAAAAEISIDESGAAAEIRSIYVYIKDSYDFTDKPHEMSQYLGHWSRKGVIVVPYNGLVGELNVPSIYLPYPVARGDVKIPGNIFYPIHNNDFRQWAIKHQRGGDFITFSDRLHVRLRKPIQIYF